MSRRQDTIRETPPTLIIDITTTRRRRLVWSLNSVGNGRMRMTTSVAMFCTFDVSHSHPSVWAWDEKL